jgi:hypothetical protein
LCEQYKKAIEGAWKDGKIYEDDVQFIIKLQHVLGISESDAIEIETAVMGKAKEKLVYCDQNLEKSMGLPTEGKPNPPISPLGTYIGTCTNITIDPPITAEIVLILMAIDGNRIGGELTIHGKMIGGSPFTGVLSDKCLSFVTRGEGASITWMGGLVYGKIQGNYGVVLGGHLGLPCAERNQYGNWECRKVGI